MLTSISSVHNTEAWKLLSRSFTATAIPSFPSFILRCHCVSVVALVFETTWEIVTMVRTQRCFSDSLLIPRHYLWLLYPINIQAHKPRNSLNLPELFHKDYESTKKKKKGFFLFIVVFSFSFSIFFFFLQAGGANGLPSMFDQIRSTALNTTSPALTSRVACSTESKKR